MAAKPAPRAAGDTGRSRDPDVDAETPVRLELRRPGARGARQYGLTIARALGSEVIEQVHRQVIEVAKRAGVTHGRRFRIDTTVVATHVHYPTDSTLLQDGMRVLTRTMQRASTALGDRAGRIRNRLRSVTRRVLTIAYEARSPKTRSGLV